MNQWSRIETVVILGCQLKREQYWDLMFPLASTWNHESVRVTRPHFCVHTEKPTIHARIGRVADVATVRPCGGCCHGHSLLFVSLERLINKKVYRSLGPFSREAKLHKTKFAD